MGQDCGEDSHCFAQRGLLGETGITEAARSDEMAEDTVSLTALTEAELRRIVNDERYRELMQELLPCHSDGGCDVGNSSDYQESSTSDLSDADSSSGSHSSPRRRRGKVDSSKGGREKGPSSRRGVDHSSWKAKGADHSSSSRKASSSSSIRKSHHKMVGHSSSHRGADHPSGSRRRRDSPSRRSSRLDAGNCSEGEPVRRKCIAVSVERPVKRPRLSAGKRKTSQSESAPSNKRRRTESHSGSSESGSEGDESEGFNPTLEQEDRDEFRMDVPHPMEKFVNRPFHEGLTKEERTCSHAEERPGTKCKGC